jgi:hypothetical protein
VTGTKVRPEDVTLEQFQKLIFRICDEHPSTVNPTSPNARYGCAYRVGRGDKIGTRCLVGEALRQLGVRYSASWEGKGAIHVGNHFGFRTDVVNFMYETQMIADSSKHGARNTWGHVVGELRLRYPEEVRS